nr:MAG TPA: hypothetical protein [Caudoviricetes sp.]
MSTHHSTILHHWRIRTYTVDVQSLNPICQQTQDCHFG